MKTKPRLVEKGKIEFGTFYCPIENVNLIDAKIAPGLGLPKWLKSLRLKEFQAFQGGDGRYFFNVALFNAKVSAFAQIRVFDIVKEKHYIYEKKLLPAQLKVPNNVLNSNNFFKGGGIDIRMENRLSEDYIKVVFEGSAKGDMPALKAEVVGHFDGTDHLVASIPFAENRGMYAHKGIVPMTGKLEIDGEVYEFKKESSFFFADDHKGYYPYVLKWDWIAAAFVSDKGLIGFSLTDNQSIDSNKYNENAIWINGKLTKLPAIKFTRENNQWWIKDSQGMINLCFIPKYPKRVKLNLGLLGSTDYEGPFGYVSGMIQLPDETIEVDEVFAFAEKQYIRC